MGLLYVHGVAILPLPRDDSRIFTRESRENRHIDREMRQEFKADKRKQRADEWRTYNRRLEKAAAISSTTIVCHRDTWRFADLLARYDETCSYAEPTKDEIKGRPGGMQEVRLSGPNLATLLTVTRKRKRSWLRIALSPSVFTRRSALWWTPWIRQARAGRCRRSSSTLPQAPTMRHRTS